MGILCLIIFKSDEKSEVFFDKYFQKQHYISVVCYKQSDREMISIFVLDAALLFSFVLIIQASSRSSFSKVCISQCS
jgi:hypothetical protein